MTFKINPQGVPGELATAKAMAAASNGDTIEFQVSKDLEPAMSGGFVGYVKSMATELGKDINFTWKVI